MMMPKTIPPGNKLILFHRGDYWYPTEYPAEYEDWQAEADRNPGTTKITDHTGCVILWQPKETSE